MSEHIKKAGNFIYNGKVCVMLYHTYQHTMEFVIPDNKSLIIRVYCSNCCDNRNENPRAISLSHELLDSIKYSKPFTRIQKIELLMKSRLLYGVVEAWLTTDLVKCIIDRNREKEHENRNL